LAKFEPDLAKFRSICKNGTENTELKTTSPNHVQRTLRGFHIVFVSLLCDLGVSVVHWFRDSKIRA